MLDLRKIFEDIGNRFTRELRLNIRNQKDIRGKRFSYIKPSTALIRQSILGANRSHVSIGSNKGMNVSTGKKRKSPATSVPLTRLLFTKRFWQGAFSHRAEKDSVSIAVSLDVYPDITKSGSSKSVTYSDIVKTNNLGSPQVNKNIVDPPLIFPNDEKEVMMMEAYKQAVDRFEVAMKNGEIEEMMLEQGLAKMDLRLQI